MGEVAAREENEKHVPPRPLAHRLDSMPALVPRSGLDPPKAATDLDFIAAIIHEDGEQIVRRIQVEEWFAPYYPHNHECHLDLRPG